MPSGDMPERVFGSRAKMRVLHALYSMTEQELTGREIARRCVLTPARTHAVLKELSGVGLVKLRIIGRNHMYSFNRDSYLMDGIKVIFGDTSSPEAHLKRIMTEELNDRRILSAAIIKAVSDSVPVGVSQPIVLVVVDSESSVSTLSRKMDVLRDRLSRVLGRSGEVRIFSVEKFRQQAQEVGSDAAAALANSAVVLGEPLSSLASEKWRAQRFRFPLFHRA